MEILQSLYQQRLNSITESFLNLLQQLEKTISPFTEPMLIQHRVDYLRHIITVTLESDREKHIKNLQDELRRLKTSIAQQISPILEKPLNHSKVVSRNSTCSRESEEIKDSFELQQKNTPLRQSKKSSIKFEQTSSDSDWSLCESSASTVLKKRAANCRSQTQIIFSQEVREKPEQRDIQDNFQFKYLRIRKQ